MTISILTLRRRERGRVHERESEGGGRERSISPKIQMKYFYLKIIAYSHLNESDDFELCQNNIKTSVNLEDSERF